MGSLTLLAPKNEKLEHRKKTNSNLKDSNTIGIDFLDFTSKNSIIFRNIFFIIQGMIQ
jgi:hypothetical protein